MKTQYMSLCSGYGGLDTAVERLTGAVPVAYAEILEPAARVMEARYPGIPNLGDISQIDWEWWVGQVDYLAAGFPCQDISNAGTREGISGSRSGIWRHVAEAVGVLRPKLVFLENVAAIRSRGLDVVAEDLASVGYDLRWTCVRASDLGYAHPRDRWFGLARPRRTRQQGVQNPYRQSGQ